MAKTPAVVYRNDDTLTWLGGWGSDRRFRTSPVMLLGLPGERRLQGCHLFHYDGLALGVGLAVNIRKYTGLISFRRWMVSGMLVRVFVGLGRVFTLAQYVRNHCRRNAWLQ